MKWALYNFIRPKNKVSLKVHLILHGIGSRYDEHKEITHKTEAELITQGYVRAYGYVDEMRYFGIPVYMKLSNFREYKLDPEKDPRDTSFTLDDFYHSNTTEDFKKGLSKLMRGSQMDIKMIGVIVLVLVIAGGFILLFGAR